MTTEEFWYEVNRITEGFTLLPILPPSNQVTKFMMKSAIQQLIYRLYESGGHVLDNFDAPILDFDDVEVIVNRTAYTMRVSTVRKRPATLLDDAWPEGVPS